MIIEEKIRKLRAELLKCNFCLAELLDIITLEECTMHINIFEAIIDPETMKENEFMETQIFTVGYAESWANYYLKDKYANAEVIYWAFDKEDDEFKITILPQMDDMDIGSSADAHSIILSDLIDNFRIQSNNHIYISDVEGFALPKAEDEHSVSQCFTLGWADISASMYLCDRFANAAVKKITLQKHGDLCVTLIPFEE